MFVTGFGPFGSITENPSSALAESCGLPYRVLEVSFAAVDAFTEDSDLTAHGELLLIGVNDGAETLRLETVARNAIGASADVAGEVRGPGPIDPRLPAQLAATLWPAEILGDDPRWDPSVDAGTYLCNYVFFRALAALPEKRVGFLHVPSFAKMAFEEQRKRLAELLEALSASAR